MTTLRSTTKIYLLFGLVLAGWLAVYLGIFERSVPVEKDASRIETGELPVTHKVLKQSDSETKDVDSVPPKKSKTVYERLAADTDKLTETSSGHSLRHMSSDEISPRKSAMAVENVVLAERLCGVELAAVARQEIAEDKAKQPQPFAEERRVLAKLWRETFACNEAYAGDNCFAARWHMCQRTYAEYGPDGIVVKGLIKAIVKK